MGAETIGNMMQRWACRFWLQALIMMRPVTSGVREDIHRKLPQREREGGRWGLGQRSKVKVLFVLMSFQGGDGGGGGLKSTFSFQYSLEGLCVATSASDWIEFSFSPTQEPTHPECLAKVSHSIYSSVIKLSELSEEGILSIAGWYNLSFYNIRDQTKFARSKRPAPDFKRGNPQNITFISQNVKTLNIYKYALWGLKFGNLMWLGWAPSCGCDTVILWKYFSEILFWQIALITCSLHWADCQDLIFWRPTLF